MMAKIKNMFKIKPNISVLIINVNRFNLPIKSKNYQIGLFSYSEYKEKWKNLTILVWGFYRTLSETDIDQALNKLPHLT